MKTKLALCSLVTAGLLGFGLTYSASKAVESPPQKPTVVEQKVQPLSLLERGRRATCDFMPAKQYGGGGTATLISRIKLKNGKYQYRALTAFHVVSRLAIEIIKNEKGLDKSATLTLQPTFHSKPLRIAITIDDIDWAIPGQDWATFIFESQHRLECAVVATAEEFKAIKAFERIYVVGCASPFGQQCRAGVISTTHNMSAFPALQQKSIQPWNTHPYNYFRISSPIWYGDSGGAVFSKDGKLIGIINAFTIRNHQGGYVTHSGVALKAHIVRAMTKLANDSKFFLVEK